jgi:hypothetical protein
VALERRSFLYNCKRALLELIETDMMDVGFRLLRCSFNGEWSTVNVTVALELLFWSIGFGRFAMSFQVVKLKRWV